MDDLNELRIFVRVAEAGNFAEAARHLGMTTSSASKAVRRLEEKLGARLLSRTTRAVAQTNEGAQVLSGARRILEEAEALRDALTDRAEAPRGKLLIAAPEAFGRVWMTERVLAFMCRHRQVEVELIFDDRQGDMVQEGVDLAVRSGDLGNSPNLISRRFFEDEILTLGTPAYLERMGAPQAPGDLVAHCVVHMRDRNTGRLMPFRFGEGGETVTRLFDPRLVTNSVAALEQAALAGIGLVQLPGIVARAALARGDLVEVLPGFRGPRLPYALVYPERRLLPARVKAFADFLISEPPGAGDALI